jgi:hypothetical protein
VIGRWGDAVGGEFELVVDGRSESMPILGWIEGMASDTFPMSVEAVARGSKGPKVRPSDSALRR